MTTLTSTEISAINITEQLNLALTAQLENLGIVGKFLLTCTTIHPYESFKVTLSFSGIESHMAHVFLKAACLMVQENKNAYVYADVEVMEVLKLDREYNLLFAIITY